METNYQAEIKNMMSWYDNPQIIKVELRPYWETEALDILDPGSIECTVAYGTLDQNEKNFALPER